MREALQSDFCFSVRVKFYYFVGFCLKQLFSILEYQKMSQTLKSNSYKYPQSKSIYGTLPNFMRNSRRRNVSILNFPIPVDDELKAKSVDEPKRFCSLRSVVPLTPSSTSSSYSSAKIRIPEKSSYSFRLPDEMNAQKKSEKIAVTESPQATSKANKNRKILNLFKNYKSLLTRFQKHFTLGDSKKVVTCHMENNRLEHVQIPIVVEKFQNKSTQTSVSDKNEYDLLNECNSSRIKLNYVRIDSSPASTPSSSSASLSFNLSTDNYHDRLCDLEVASYFNKSSKASENTDADDGVDVDGYDEENADDDIDDDQNHVSNGVLLMRPQKLDKQVTYDNFDHSKKALSQPCQNFNFNFKRNTLKNINYFDSLNKNSFLLSNGGNCSNRNNSHRYYKNYKLTDFGTLC
jgi:hypothetical protein